MWKNFGLATWPWLPLLFFRLRHNPADAGNGTRQLPSILGLGKAWYKCLLLEIGLGQLPSGLDSCRCGYIKPIWATTLTWNMKLTAYVASDTPCNSVNPHLHKWQQLRPYSVCVCTPVTEKGLFLDCTPCTPQHHSSVCLQSWVCSAASQIHKGHPNLSTAADHWGPGASAPQKKLERAIYALISSVVLSHSHAPKPQLHPACPKTPRQRHSSLHFPFILFLFMRMCTISLLLHLLLTGHQAFLFVV